MTDIQAILESIGMPYEVHERAFTFVSNVNSLECADTQSLSFGTDSNRIQMSKAGVVICKEVFETDKTLIIVSNPRLAFIRAMKAHFNNQRGLITIGTNVIIEPGTVVGCNGFSFERNENGELERFPHIGGVKIGDNVQIGSNCTIERGTFGDTVIGEGSQIDNLILVGHNSVIGKHVVVVGVTIICGSVTIGDYAYIGAGVTLRDGITIGKKAFVGMGSVVTKNVPDNVTVYGVPARVI